MERGPGIYGDQRLIFYPERMDFLSAITGVIFNHAWDPIRRHSGYLISYKRNINKLVTKFDELDALRKDVQDRVDAARRERLEEVNNEVQTWLMNVGRMEEEVKKIKEKAAVISNKHFLHIGLHYKLGKEAANHIKTIDALLEDGNKFGSVSHERPPGGPSTTDSLLYDEDFMIFNSRKSHVKKILEALMDEAVHSIGLWGMGGVGKTMLVKKVAKHATEQSLFGEVMMVTVSQNIDLKRIQTVIAESLGLKFEEESIEVRATKLADRLTATENRVLVILDDLWEPLHLPMVGILLPWMATTCKVVITTRSKDVCERMGCQEMVELKTLTDEESWTLFKSRTADAVEYPEIRYLAHRVARECAGLPLALVVLGEVLKGEKPENWNTVLEQLRNSIEVDLPYVSKQVIQSIKLSFDFLESEAAKSCFLHCCLYPEDYDIPKEELMHLMVGGGILIGDETLNDAQGTVDLLLDRLKTRCLVLQGSSESCIRMHDIVRDVAIQIGAAADHAFYARAGHGLTGWPRTTESEMRNCQRLSLMDNDIEDLPPNPMLYPKLELLILSCNERLSSIPEMFFIYIRFLMVLDLSNTGIESLPKSLSCLTNLRVLNLGGCGFLKDISSINGLKMLEILILDGCPVSIVPKGVGWTQNLRIVDLGCSMNDYFSMELTRFHRLEQLFMDKFVGSFQELIISLRYLTHLFINEVVDLDDLLSHELVSPGAWPDQLVKFSLSFLKGQPWHWYDSIDRRALKLMGSKPLAVWVKRLLKKTIQLALVEFQETELISIDWLSLSSLEYLEVVKWPNLTKLLGDELLLPTLEDLDIINWQEMSEMISPPASLQALYFFQRLRELHIESCPRLTHLFSYKQAISMQHLSDLYIEDCVALKAVVISMEIEDGASASTSTHVVDHESYNSPFPNLRSLFLRGLPQLTAFHHPITLPIDRFYPEYSRIGERPKVQHPLFVHRTPAHEQELYTAEDYVIFDSRKSRVKKILEALKDEAVHLIGLYGMGGAGKTTLVKEVAEQAKKQKLFGEVVMVTVSQNNDLKRIQTIMARCLGLKLEQASVEVRATKLADRLTTTRNEVLVILDDLWEQLHLSMVGIRLPEMAATCKVVITTRNKYVCEIMRCQEIVELNKLSDEESWTLFKSRAGDVVDSPIMRKLAQNVIKECAGLPLKLVVLGDALMGKSPEIWETLLMALKMSGVDLPGVSKQAFKSIQLSFDFLESEVAKSCFLHCCLYPEDYDIPKEELMHLMVGGGILIGDETLNDAQGTVDLLLDRLKTRCLVLQGSSESCVRMHDIVRDVAIQIGAAADHAFYARAGQGLTGWLRTTESEMRNCQRLSLMDNDIEDLRPDPMLYPKLEMLILRNNWRLSSIPEMFFLHMGCLMVLDLSNTSIESLPKSLSCLTNLRVLNLGGCYFLKDISHINGLKMLEILILEGCPVSIAPEGVGWPQHLRFVNLSCSMDDYFSKEFPRFHWLEQLFMNKFAGSFRELIISLRHLTHLFIAEVVDVDDQLSHELVSSSSWPNRLLKFSLSFLKDRPWKWHDSIDRRGLKLMGTKPLAIWVKRLLETTMQLALVEFQETELISIDWLSLSSLEYLELVNWPNLTKMLGDELLLHEQISFSQLKEMIIDNCPRLTSLLPFTLWQKLEGLSVKDCPMMLTLFPRDQGAHNKTEWLPRLRTLYLVGLQSLRNVLQPFQCLPNLKKLSINDCGVRYVVSEAVAILTHPFPTLENLDITNCQKMSEMISPLASLQSPCFFQRLRELQIWSCPRLMHLFSYKQAISMQHLSRLYIRDCAVLGVVVISKENEEQASSRAHIANHESYNSPFPNLRHLTLVDLPQLTAFHHPRAPPVKWLHLTSYKIQGCPELQEPLEGLQSLQNVLQPFQWLPNLKKLSINDCGVRYVVSSETETVAILAHPFPTLENLDITNCQEMSEMISPLASLQAPCFFQRLKELQIWSCPRLMHLFSYKQAISMQHLSRLYIRDCAVLGAVVISKENEEQASSRAHIANHESYNSPFPNLRHLTLVDLPQLTAFHHPRAPPVKWLHLTSYKIVGCPELQEPLEERIRSLRTRMEKEAGSVKGDEDEGKEEEAGDL